MANPRIQVKQGSTTPPIGFRIKKNRKVIGIQGADVYLHFRSIDGTGDVYGGLCSNLDAGNNESRGAAELDPSLVSGAPVGYYYAEAKIVWSPGTAEQEITYLPNDGRGFELAEVIASYDTLPVPEAPSGDDVNPGVLLSFAVEPTMLITGEITRDSNGAATSAEVVWPDGAWGIYTADVLSTRFPGAVDAYHITHTISGVTKTYTQPTVSRDQATGALTHRPAIVVS